MIDPDTKRLCRRKLEGLLRQHKRPTHGWSGRKRQQRFEAMYHAAMDVLLSLDSEPYGDAIRRAMEIEDDLTKLVNDFIAEMGLDDG